MLLLQENWPTRPRVRSCFSFKCDCKMPWVMISCLKYCLSNAKYLLNIPAWNFKSCSFYSTKPFQLSSSFEIIVQISDIHISKIWSKQDAWNCLTKSPTQEENHLRKVIIIIAFAFSQQVLRWTILVFFFWSFLLHQNIALGLQA